MNHKYTKKEAEEIYKILDRQLKEYLETGKWTKSFLYYENEENCNVGPYSNVMCMGEYVHLDCIGELEHIEKGDTMDNIFGSMEDYFNSFQYEFEEDK